MKIALKDIFLGLGVSQRYGKFLPALGNASKMTGTVDACAKVHLSSEERAYLAYASDACEERNLKRNPSERPCQLIKVGPRMVVLCMATLEKRLFSIFLAMDSLSTSGSPRWRIRLFCVQKQNTQSDPSVSCLNHAELSPSDARGQLETGIAPRCARRTWSSSQA